MLRINLKRTLPRRLLSFAKSLVVSEEVQQALSENKPVVSLESTILTHGFPYPDNLTLGAEFEQIVRDEGGVPATIAFLQGKPHVGLNSEQLNYLTESYKSVVKVSRRDIGHVMSHKLNGGTTIALTTILSALAGIKVFGTGGLGGVHREASQTFDISNDLVELGRNPVSVVCAGPKSILDIGLTMEYLETQGVYVSTYNDGSRSGSGNEVEIPGFYSRRSGVKSPYSFSSFKEIADIIYNHNQVVDSGSIICIPPPKEHELPYDMIMSIIEESIQEASAKNITGKNVTPFLLLKIGEKTGGASLSCNKNFVKNNIKCATKIAKELSQVSNY